MLTRQDFLRSATASAFAAGTAGLLSPALGGGLVHAQSAQAMQNVAVQLEWIKDAEFAGYWLADNKGFYKAAGINPVWIAGGPTVEVQATVASGRALIGILGSTTTLAQAVAKGAPLVAIAANYQSSPEGILSLPSKPIHTAKDLVGKKLALSPGAQTEMNAIYKINGINPSSVTHVPEGTDPTALITGQVDALFAFAFNEPIALKKRGIKGVFTSLDQLGLPSYGNVLIALKSTLDSQHDLIVSWLRATIKGWQLEMANPSPGADLAVKVYGKSNNLDLVEQRMESAAELPFLGSSFTKKHGLFMMEPAKWTSIAHSWKALGIAGLPPVTSMYSLDFLKAAYQGKSTIS